MTARQFRKQVFIHFDWPLKLCTNTPMFLIKNLKTEKNLKTPEVLFDSGSQETYTLNARKNFLQLDPVSKQNLAIKIFRGISDQTKV